MHRDFTFRRRVLVWGLGALLFADAALAAYSWHLATVPRTPEYVLARQIRELKVLGGEIDRAKRIKENLPATMAACGRFEKSMLPASTGYSVVTADLGDLAKKAGLNLQAVSFHQTGVKGRPLYEVQMDASVTGDYPGVVKFINGLQQSKDVFVVESLALGTGSGAAGQSTTIGALIQVKLRLRTYYRT